MTLTLAIIINVVLDVALLGALAFVMSRASKLTPHRAAVAATESALSVQSAAPRRRRRDGRIGARLRPAFD